MLRYLAENGRFRPSELKVPTLSTDFKLIAVSVQLPQEHCETCVVLYAGVDTRPIA